MQPELIRVGHVIAPLGVAGAVRLYVLGNVQQLLGVPRLLVEDAGWLRVRQIEAHGPGVAVLFTGVTGREGAERLQGKQVYAHEDELPPLPEDEYYYHELRGLPVLAPSGERIGEVLDVQDAGAQDLLVVRHAAGEALVPLQAPYVEVRRGQAVVLDAPPGLLSEA